MKTKTEVLLMAVAITEFAPIVFGAALYLYSVGALLATLSHGSW